MTTFQIYFLPHHVKIFYLHNGFPRRRISNPRLAIRHSFIMKILSFHNFLPQSIFIFKFPPPFNQEALLHTLDHITMWYFLFHRKHLLCLSYFAIKFLFIRNMAIWKDGRLARTELSKIALAPIDIALPFQAPKYIFL